MKFKNTPNRCVVVEGKECWISRSVTVLPVLFFVQNDQKYVPLGQRGADLPDEVGKWGLPGGYLDFDETISEAIVREVWEELGINIPQLKGAYPFEGSIEKPYDIISLPRYRQNVTLKFPLMFHLGNAALPLLKPQVDQGEVLEARWFEVDKALEMDLAFNHQAVMQECLNTCFS
ncbi:NUDIX hydrolase [Romeria aff. gracilis LEGE 07310]|uniref:NUDIX hydrolase n=1 Tax=Vasconcelosia minhoensis LEGE 07310 TaxID=915328 RepID=A0A8J7APV9_9CYAN|nr:NUDIX hydrolase [Romeria gracilis]MBE9078444.1 NUDIX hydrolase [Romeria aff. gracilis LEGE 07310]